MSRKPTRQDVRLNIHPGEWYFGKEYESLYTVLGSCVSLSLWHPKLKIGGLCHYLLPAQPSHLHDATGDGRYGKTILPLLKQAMMRYANPGEFELGLFGGGDTLSNHGIGKQNILFAQHWLQDEKLFLKHMDVGGKISRSLLLEMETGY
jgi:chemotaxis protein CheD